MPCPSRPLLRLASALVLCSLVMTSCALVDNSPASWDALPIGDIVAEARTAEPAEWAALPDDQFGADSWPVAIPAPAFLANSNIVVIGNTTDIRTNKQPSASDASAYVALLFSVGFEVDTRARSDGWLTRDGVEWVQLANLPTLAYMNGGDFSRPDPRSSEFVVRWTADPSSITG